MRTEGDYSFPISVFTASCYIFKAQVFHGKKISNFNTFFYKKKSLCVLFWSMGCVCVLEFSHVSENENWN